MEPSNVLLHVTIKSREGIVYESDCKSVSSYNKVGKFDILGLHANFITLVEKELILIGPNGEQNTMKIETGVCKVKANQVTVYLAVRQPGVPIPTSVV